MDNEISELFEDVKAQTIKNRNDLLEVLRKSKNNDIILFLIEEFKSYCSMDNTEKNVSAGQYMIFLDAVQTILTERKFLCKLVPGLLKNFSTISHFILLYHRTK